MKVKEDEKKVSLEASSSKEVYVCAMMEKEELKSKRMELLEHASRAEKAIGDLKYALEAEDDHVRELQLKVRKRGV
jgi:hypothetical protein